MEQFNTPNSINPHENNAFREDLSAKLGDGILSHEEAQELHDKYSDMREQLDSLYADGRDEILNLTKQQKSLLLQVVDSNQAKESLSETGEYFSINLEALDRILTDNNLDLSISIYLSGFKDYIENHLTSLDVAIKEKIILSIRGRIRKLVWKISKIKQGAREKIIKQGGNLDDLSTMRWIVNSEIQSVFDEITNKILPSAFMIQEYNKSQDKDMFIEEVVESLEYEEYEMTGGEYGIGNGVITVEMQKDITRGQFKRNIEQSIEMFDAPVDKKNGQFDEFGWNHNAQIDTLQINRGGHAKRFEAIGGDIKSIQEISLLNEGDKQIETDASIAYLLALIPQFLPYVGAPVSLASDLRSLFTNQDGILLNLKSLGIVPEEYNMNELSFEWLMGLLGIGSTAFGLQAATKAGKLGKVGKVLSRLSPQELSSSIYSIGKKMGISSDILDNVKDLISGTRNKMGSGIDKILLKGTQKIEDVFPVTRRKDSFAVNFSIGGHVSIHYFDEAGNPVVFEGAPAVTGWLQRMLNSKYGKGNTLENTSDMGQGDTFLFTKDPDMLKTIIAFSRAKEGKKTWACSKLASDVIRKAGVDMKSILTPQTLYKALKGETQSNGITITKVTKLTTGQERGIVSASWANTALAIVVPSLTPLLLIMTVKHGGEMSIEVQDKYGNIIDNAIEGI